MLESLLEIIRDKCGASVTDRVEGMLARSGPVCLLVRDPVRVISFYHCSTILSYTFEFEFGFEAE